MIVFTCKCGGHVYRLRRRGLVRNMSNKKLHSCFIILTKDDADIAKHMLDDNIRDLHRQIEKDTLGFEVTQENDVVKLLG